MDSPSTLGTKIVKRTQNETKVMYEEAIRQNIAKKDWQKLSEVIIRAGKGLK